MVVVERAEPVAGPSAVTTWWDGVRWALLVVWVLLAVATVLTGAQPSSDADLRAALESGHVHSVDLSDGLGGSAGGSGYALQQVRWRQGPLTHQATVLDVRAQALSDVPDDTRSRASAVVHHDLGDTLSTAYPAVRVHRHALSESGWSGTFLGWPVPTPLSVATLVAGLATLWLIINAPQPWWATRWAWFWLIWVPFVPAVFLALVGPTPPLPARPRGHRLRGGWAFLLALLLGHALDHYR